MTGHLRLERRDQPEPADAGVLDFGGKVVMITPPIDEAYWTYRVGITEAQAVVGFPKFGTIGIGFAVEDEDWNTNLPWTSPAQDILDHIWRNAGSSFDKVPGPVARAVVLKAIEMIQQAVREDRQASREKENEK